MSGLKQFVSRVLSDDAGQDLIEYALVGALLSLCAITVMKNVATDIGNGFTHIGTTLTTTV